MNRILIFLDLLWAPYYETRIGLRLAWELSKIFNESDALDDFIPLEEWICENETMPSL